MKKNQKLLGDEKHFSKNRDGNFETAIRGEKHHIFWFLLEISSDIGSGLVNHLCCLEFLRLPH